VYPGLVGPDRRTLNKPPVPGEKRQRELRP
jgi:hypothetical protein